MKLLADASIQDVLRAFPKPFEVTFYKEKADIPLLLKDHEILLCRSTLKIDSQLLQENSQHLRFVATASSGTDHIDGHYLQQHNIQLVDAKGCNAEAVADYVLASIAVLITEKNFTGTTAGIIGLGVVGTVVAKRLRTLGFNVLYFDPLKSPSEEFLSVSLERIMECPLICIHANLHDDGPFPSRHLLDTPELLRLKPDTAIINASRGDIVNEAALLKLATPIYYCTDVYHNEPDINENIIRISTLCTPHIAGHSIEAKIKAVILLSQQLHDYYGIATPDYTEAKPLEMAESKERSWQDQILSLYNPMSETLQLKSSFSKKEAFQQIRRSHNTRHDFRIYSSSFTNKQLKTIFKPE